MKWVTASWTYSMSPMYTVWSTEIEHNMLENFFFICYWLLINIAKQKNLTHMLYILGIQSVQYILSKITIPLFYIMAIFWIL